MKIVVTGSAGTVGAPLVAELRERGHDVWGIELQHTGQPQTIRADIADYRQLRAAFDKVGDFDLVYHLAAEFGRLNGEEFYEKVWETNAIGTRNVLELQRERGFRHVFASSSEVYGEADAEAIDERYLLDNPQPRLTNDYAISKRVNEEQIRNFADRYGNKTMTLRFFNAYGPGERYHDYRSVVCLFAYRLLTGKPITVYENYHRVFMYAGDFIPTLANAADNFAPGETVNVGGDEYVSVEDMANMLLDVTGAHPSLVNRLPLDKHNVTSKKPDISKAKALLHHNPRTRLAQGLPLTVDWMRKHYEIGG
jgi:dTDP-glucose 4,6-dehydratase